MSKGREPGKRIGGAVYVHASAAQDVIPADILEPAQRILQDKVGDWPWEVAKWNKKTGAVTFVQVPGFDQEPEPIVGDSILVRPDGTCRQRTQPRDPEVYHHKWQFVAPGYAGFDLQESRARSAAWESLEGVDRSRIGKLSYWRQVEERLRAPGQSSGVVSQEYDMAEVDDLVPHPDNPRRGDLETIQESVEVNGFYGAVIAQKSTGRILAGNHRWQAARRAGLEHVPVIWVDVDDQEAMRILLVDNGANDRAGYDESSLRHLLQRAQEGPGLAGTGYRAQDLQRIIAKADAASKRSEAADGRAILQRFRETDQEAARQLLGLETSIERSSVSAPVRFYQDQGLLEGEVLDYGAGRDPHDYAKFDPAWFPDYELLTRSWDVVMCNFVLNVLPFYHSRFELLATLRQLSRRRILVAVWSKSQEEETISRSGYQSGWSRQDWEEFIARFCPGAESLKSSGFWAWRIEHGN